MFFYYLVYFLDEKVYLERFGNFFKIVELLVIRGEF